MTVKSISLFLPSLVGGGAERVFLTLAKGFLDRNFQVDLVLAGKFGELVDQVDPRANVVDLGCKHVIMSLTKLIKYIKTKKPTVILSALTHANIIVIWAKLLTNSSVKIIATEHLPFPERKMHGFDIKELVIPTLVRWFYPFADKIVAVSHDVANSIPRSFRKQTNKNQVIYNPLDIKDIIKKANAPPEHAWLKAKTKKIILSVGRLNRQKDFPTLIRAFAQVCKHQPSRLIILGEGEERSNLEMLVRELGISSEVSLPGFVQNPYPFMKHADLFVLSSIAEGFPVVLEEAIACGIPVISTNCPGGSKEILADGVYGVLVPVGDENAIAEAIKKILINPPDTKEARKRANDFDLEKVIGNYIDLIHEISQPAALI
ncbi:MAG: glycosyltransferase [Anaerolineaceae bacterium]|nr:glycosyltransferase [Anaerolineaceae bacterium]